MGRKVPGKAERFFTTGVNMITSIGTDGPNIMTAEWVMQISYDPVLLGLFIHEGTKTLKNIEKTREFGVNVASQEQATEVSIAGGYSGTEIEKLKLKNIFKILKSRKIKTPLIAGCTINAECRLVMKKKIGDHIMLIGEVVDIRHDDSKKPLLYHRGRYFGITETIEPERNAVKVSKETLDLFKSLANGRFILKCVGTIVESKNKILVMTLPRTKLETIPFSLPPAGKNQRDHLVEFLDQMGFNLQIETSPIMKRLVLENGKDIQRINFVLFRGKSKKAIKNSNWKLPSEDIFIASLV